MAGTWFKLGFLFEKFVGTLPGLASIHGSRFRDKAPQALKVFDEVLGLFADFVKNRPPGWLPFSVVKMNEVEKQIGNTIAVSLSDNDQLLTKSIRRGLLVGDAIKVKTAHAVLCTNLSPSHISRPYGGNQPIAQLLRRNTIDLVVVSNFLQQPRFFGFSPVFVCHDAAAGRFDFAGSRFHIENFEVFEGIGRLRRDERT